ncbi:hypothetical protein [Flavisolibacter nicotianae]|uniref:hypothetical protein n=1 Tax=Flavisolibacter nicotianae TaxID=2364882 RepID=UPI0013C4968F|nr:hypothetical protein [Flavisolibacter nicotianae]
MRPKIKTYEDLLQEEQRLTAQLASYKEVIREDITGLKASLNPVKRVVAGAKNLFTFDDNGPLLNFGLKFGTDVFLRKLLLGRAGWIAKVVVPYVIKNYASHLITEGQRKAVAKTVSNLVSKFMMKKKKEPFEAAPPA